VACRQVPGKDREKHLAGAKLKNSEREAIKAGQGNL